MSFVALFVALFVAPSTAMLPSFLLSLIVLTSAQTREPQPLEPGRVESALAALKSAFENGKAQERAAAIVAEQEVIDPAVLAWFAKGLKDSDKAVRDAAAQALRFARHADALTALQDALKRERKSGKDVDELIKLTKCMGQHQSAASIPLLLDDPFRYENGRVLEAQVFSLANTRTKRAAEELIAMMRTASREKVQNHMPTFRLALIVITGADQGLSQDAWTKWWNDNKHKLEIPEKLPALPKEMLDRWNNYWGLEYVRARPKKRGERGDDPEGGR